MKATTRNVVVTVSGSILVACALSPVTGCVGLVGDFPVGNIDGGLDGTTGEDAALRGDGASSSHDTGTAPPDARTDTSGGPYDAGEDTSSGSQDASEDAPVDATPNCNATQLLCNGVCVPIDTDNCGSCNSMCTGGTPECAPNDAGTYGCVSGCPAATPSLCGSTCTDTTSDPSNCATCNHTCTTTVSGATATCTNSTCGYECPANDTYCSQSNACVDLSSDSNNCKTCGNVCPAPSTCQSSTCTCPSPDTLCGNACTNTANDPKNCSTCNHECPTNETCAGGTCECAPPYLLCGTTCIDPTSSIDNCGACNYACGIGSCENSICLPATITVAGSNFGALDQRGNIFTLAQSAGVLYGGAVTASALVDYASGFSTPFGLVTIPSQGLVYVCDSGNDHIDAYYTSNGASDFVMAANDGSTTYPLGIGTDGSNVYWTLGDGFAELMKAPGGQNTPTPLYRAVGGNNIGMVYDSTSASLFMEGLVGSTNGIIKCPVAGTACTILTSPPSTASVASYATTPGTLYYSLYDSTGGTGGIFSCPTSTCTTPTPIANGATWSGGGAITIDTTYNYIYFIADQTSTGETGLFRCPLAGCGSGGPQTVIPFGYLEGSEWLLNDSTALYWSNGGENVSRLLKHP